MTRRRLLLALAGAALAAPIPAVAHQPAGAPRIGLLSGDPRAADSFRGHLDFPVGRPAQLRTRPDGKRPAGGRLCRKDPEGRQPRRSTGPTADPIPPRSSTSPTK